jgi:hypothetical protein
VEDAVSAATDLVLRGLGANPRRVVAVQGVVIAKNPLLATAARCTALGLRVLAAISKYA